MHSSYTREIADATEIFFDYSLHSEMLEDSDTQSELVARIAQTKLLRLSILRNYTVESGTFAPTSFEIILEMEEKAQLRITGKLNNEHNPKECKFWIREWGTDWTECLVEEDELSYYARSLIRSPLDSKPSS